MTKTFLGIVCLLITAMTPAMADNSLKVRCAAFFPMENRFTKIYGNEGIDFDVEYSTTIFCNSCIDAWVNLNWFPKRGHLKHCGSSKIDLLNLSFGLKSSYCLCDSVHLYAGIGPTFGWVWLENKTTCRIDSEKKKDKDSKFAVGGIVKTGILYYVSCNIFLDLFVDYFYEPVHFHHYVDVGGFRAGLGLGASF